MKRFAALAAFLATSTVEAAATIEIDTASESGTKDGTCTFALDFYKASSTATFQNPASKCVDQYTTADDLKTIAFDNVSVNKCYVP